MKCEIAKTMQITNWQFGQGTVTQSRGYSPTVSRGQPTRTLVCSSSEADKSFTALKTKIGDQCREEER